ncbi:MAG: hypothetical protein FJY83_09740, partial [Candidatus Aminicenantes bacterium]|nr:hypothetical protein [Candidatus Aminicenantes bacterium]
MKKENTAPTFVLILGLTLVLLPSSARGQTVMGQYEEEAPLATWNLFGAPGAAALGRGASLFAPGDDASVIFANPAQAVRLPGLSVSLGGGLHSASLFRFGPVNTGPISSTENLPLDTLALDFAALTLNLKGWVIGLGAGLIEIYDRPYVEAGAASYNALFTFHQEGYLRAWNVSLARELFPGFSLGLGANLVSGRWAWEMTDRWNASPRTVTITDERSRDLEGFYLNGGVVWRLSERVSMTAAFRTPYGLSADTRSLLRYQAPGGGTDIRIEAEGASRFTRPAAAGFGVEWAARDNLRLLGEVGWWNWASYTA